MKRIIDIPDEVLESKNYCQYFGVWSAKLSETIENGKPYDEAEVWRKSNELLKKRLAYLGNPSGNAISREALKAKMFDIPKPKEGATFWDGVDTVGNLIDNAQAVPLPNEQIAWEQGYEAGLEQGKQDRPQGTWTFDEKGNFHCDKCGREPHDQYATTPYCPNCGADMRGRFVE